MSEWKDWLDNNNKNNDLNRDVINYFVNNNFLYNKMLPYKSYTILSVGSGRGIHEKIFKFLGFDVTFSDKEKDIVKNYSGKKRVFDVLKNRVNESIVFTDGLLEHFGDCDLITSLSNMNYCKVQFHCVPVQGAKKQEFGDEIYRTHKDWLSFFAFCNNNVVIESFPMSHSNKFFWLYRRVFRLGKYSPLPFELSQSGTNLYVVRRKE